MTAPVIAAVDTGCATTVDPDPLSFVEVRVTAADGTRGYGEACDCYGCFYPRTVIGVIRELLAPALVGASGAHPDRLAASLRGSLRAAGAGGAAVAAAVSAVEIALHDLLARHRGVPLADLFGRVSDRVQLYASNVLLAAGSVDDHLRELQVPATLGVRDLKARISGGREDTDTLAALRPRLAPRAAVMVDANERYDGWQAEALARRLGSIGARWLEEPVPYHRSDAVRRLGRRSPVPIAYGEHCHGIGDVLEQEALLPGSVLQVDASACGGIAELRRLAAVAESFGSRVVPHNAAGPVAFMANLHAAASSPSISMMELPFPLFPAWRRMSPDAAWLLDRIAGGEVPVPDRPGLGVELHDELFARGVVDLDQVPA